MKINIYPQEFHKPSTVKNLTLPRGTAYAYPYAFRIKAARVLRPMRSAWDPGAGPYAFRRPPAYAPFLSFPRSKTIC